MKQGEDMDDATADLALVSAAQKVEHYEIASCTAARNLAHQIKQPVVAALLQQSLSEEQNASVLLDQAARPLMSSARMPEAANVIQSNP